MNISLVCCISLRSMCSTLSSSSHSPEKRSLSSHECIIHVDFSENYLCKYSAEIQAVHFGASHQQATMHTGVLYAGEDANPLCFCTISQSKQKGPPAIWQHLDPVLDFIKARHPSVSVVHFFCDGPCTQYRRVISSCSALN